VATKAIFEKPVKRIVGMIHSRLTRTEKMSFHEKYHVLMNNSEDKKIGLVILRKCSKPRLIRFGLY